MRIVKMHSASYKYTNINRDKNSVNQGISTTGSNPWRIKYYKWDKVIGLEKGRHPREIQYHL